jgi:opacity protein-like surface antigen
MFQRVVRVAALIVMFIPGAAHADWLFTPLIGPTFGADTFGQERATYGAALAWRDEEALGLELEMSLSPGFFEDASDGALLFGGSGHVFTAMANALVGLNGDASARVQPYVTAGVGLMQMHVVSEGDLFETTTYEPGFNAGAGAMAFASDAIGFRGDVRYIRSFQNQVPSWTRGTDLDVAPGNFDFWRATVGVTFRFGE